MNTVQMNDVGLRPLVLQRARNVVEVAVAYGLLEGALWSRGRWQAGWALLTLAWVVVTTWRGGRGSVELGVGLQGFKRSWWVVAAAMGACSGAMVVAGVLGTLHGLTGPRAPLWHAGLYAVWAVVQEFLTMSYILVRLEEVTGSRAAVLITAVLFSFAHIPNGPLMVVTLAMSLVFCVLFQRYRNIYTLALAHALMGLTMSITFSSSVIHYMRVGSAYWR